MKLMGIFILVAALPCTAQQVGRTGSAPAAPATAGSKPLAIPVAVPGEIRIDEENLFSGSMLNAEQRAKILANIRVKLPPNAQGTPGLPGSYVAMAMNPPPHYFWTPRDDPIPTDPCASQLSDDQAKELADMIEIRVKQQTKTVDEFKKNIPKACKAKAVAYYLNVAIALTKQARQP